MQAETISNSGASLEVFYGVAVDGNGNVFVVNAGDGAVYGSAFVQVYDVNRQPSFVIRQNGGYQHTRTQLALCAFRYCC